MDSDGDGAQSALEVTSLDRAGPYAPGVAQRWLRSWPGKLVLSALCVMLALGALAGLLVYDGSGVAGAWDVSFGLATATPSGPVPPGGDSFVVVDAVPWGVLTVDGQRPALSDQYDLGSGFTLVRGAHHVTYQARYFSTLRCVVSVPRSVSDTCPLTTEADLGGVTNQRFLDLQAIPDRLAAAQHETLTAAITGVLSALTASATIAPGDQYINQRGDPVTASAPLTFAMGMVADPPLTACPRSCVNPEFPAQAANVWYLNEDIHPVWAVEDASGNRFTSPATLGLDTESQVSLDVTLTGSQWSVRFDQPQAALHSIAQNTALVAAQALELSPASGIGQGAAPASGGFGAVSGENPADGVIIIFPHAAGSASDELLLWRFGVLYATDAATATMFPSLPLASAHDLEVAHAIYTGLEN